MDSVPPSGPTAKALHWREPTDHPQDGFGEEHILFVANGIGGRYRITRDESTKAEGGSDVLLWFADDEYVWEAFPNVEAAQLRAEGDWQRAYRAHHAAVIEFPAHA